MFHTFLKHHMKMYASFCLSKAEKADLDMGETLVGSCHSVEVPLVNNGSCPVSFCLSVQETLKENCPSSDSEAGQSGNCFCGLPHHCFILSVMFITSVNLHVHLIFWSGRRLHTGRLILSHVAI